jgi:predicted peptidase
VVELPTGYEADEKSRWPVLIWLHGSGDYGEEYSGEQPTWRYQSGIATFARNTGHRFIVVMPHNTNWEIGWKPIQVMDVIEEISTKYRIDPDRVYLMGSSMGGFGTWATATTYPDKFAAIAPVCGIGDVADMAQLKDLPVWVVHGEYDTAVPIGPDKECVEALRRMGGRVKYSYRNEGHNVQIPRELYDWLLEQRRGQPAQERATL